MKGGRGEKKNPAATGAAALAAGPPAGNLLRAARSLPPSSPPPFPPTSYKFKEFDTNKLWLLAVNMELHSSVCSYRQSCDSKAF